MSAMMNSSYRPVRAVPAVDAPAPPRPPALDARPDHYVAVYTRGTYYSPAWTHHGDVEVRVQCCRCRREGLRVSIGAGDDDLCVPCAAEVETGVRASADKIAAVKATVLANQAELEASGACSHGGEWPSCFV